MMPSLSDEMRERDVEIRIGDRRLSGTLALPRAPKGMVLFAHGSGSGRSSPRNQLVARTLQAAGFGTLLIDLLDGQESSCVGKVFDIDLLTDRYQAAVNWLGRDPETRGLRLGYFGASTGAAAVLVAAARCPEAVGAIVSRGGRPDLARHELPQVTTPTLLIVGGSDLDVLELNRQALALLRCPKQLAVVPGATHLFAEPGTLEEVARLTTQWFQRHLARGPETGTASESGKRIPAMGSKA